MNQKSASSVAQGELMDSLWKEDGEEISGIWSELKVPVDAVLKDWRLYVSGKMDAEREF